VFVEKLAAEIADEIARTAEPHHVRVVVTQRPRGGIEVQATAERSRS
jgi:NADPH-dependent 7-cyano-7-deazaguanine reductase QueF